MNRRFQWVPFAVIMGVGLAGPGCFLHLSDSGVECFQVPEWKTGLTTERRPAGLQVRLERKGEDVLLLRQLTSMQLDDEMASGNPFTTDKDPLVIYRYRPGHRSLETVPGAAWDAAAGEVGRCPGSPPTSFRVDYHDCRLKAEDRIVPTAGRNAVLCHRSPREPVVAVASAALRNALDLFPDNSCVAYGQHYHQILRIPDGAPQGRTLRIPLSKVVSSCWSPDGRFIIYLQNETDGLCVVRREAADDRD